MYKDLINQRIEETFLTEGKSPSRMTEEEKLLYRDKLFREGDEICEYLAHQIDKCEQVRKDLRDCIQQNIELQERYDREHENFRLRL